MTTREMVERMLIDVDSDPASDDLLLDGDDSLSESDLMVLLSEMVGSEPQTISVH